MMRAKFTDRAIEHLAELESDKGADSHVLEELKQQIDVLALHPEMAFPACFPYRNGHLYSCNLFDHSGRMWSFSVLVTFTEEFMLVRAINGGLAPANYDD